MVHGYEIPPGYEPAEEAARQAGHNFEVFKRMCRNGRIPGARKLKGRAGGLWVVPEDFRILPTGGEVKSGEQRGREVSRRAHRGESKVALAREYEISHKHVSNLMNRYPDEAPSSPGDGSGTGPRLFRGQFIPPGYEPAVEAARRVGRNLKSFWRMCLEGRVPGAYKTGGSGGGLWVVPEDFRILPTSKKPRVGEKRGREIARRARAGENKAALAREYGIWRDHVYYLMERYPDEAHEEDDG